MENNEENNKVFRCPWVPKDDELYIEYHDTHWGIPCTEERTLFEYLVLEAAQAGLTWRTILVRRDEYAKAFANYDVNKVAKYTEHDVIRILRDFGIIKNRLKILSAINNAKAFLRVAAEFGSFGRYLWRFVDYKPIQNEFHDVKEYPAQTELSQFISKDLKKRGFNFVGPTIMYAYMQSCGMVNDHSVDCICQKKCAQLARLVEDVYGN